LKGKEDLGYNQIPNIFFYRLCTFFSKKRIKLKYFLINWTNRFKIKDFAQYLKRQNIKPIYIYIKKAVVNSSEKGKALPEHIITLTQSSLENFGDKVQIIDYSKYKKLKNNPRCYALIGAITAYDNDIIVRSESKNFFINLSLNNNRNKDKGKYKNKNRTSKMIADFMLEQNGTI